MIYFITFPDGRLVSNVSFQNIRCKHQALNMNVSDATWTLCFLTVCMHVCERACALNACKHAPTSVWGNARGAESEWWRNQRWNQCVCMSHTFEAVEVIVLSSELEEKNRPSVTLFSRNVCCKAESGRIYLHTITLPNTCWSCTEATDWVRYSLRDELCYQKFGTQRLTAFPDVFEYLHTWIMLMITIGSFLHFACQFMLMCWTFSTVPARKENVFLKLVSLILGLLLPCQSLIFPFLSARLALFLPLFTLAEDPEVQVQFLYPQRNWNTRYQIHFHWLA